MLILILVAIISRGLMAELASAQSAGSSSSISDRNENRKEKPE
jgi:hypothetical protein